MPVVPAVAEAENPLIAIYQDAWDRIEAQEQALLNDPLQARKRARLAEMQRSIDRILGELRDPTISWLESELPNLYATAGVEGSVAMGGEFVWTLISQEAVEELAGTMFTELLEATQHVSASSKTLIRKIAQDTALSKAIEGKTAVQAGRELSRILASNGIAAVTYRNGAKHGLGEYAEMAIRTTTAKAYNYGTLNGAAMHGCEFWECFDGPDCGWSFHDSTDQAAGKIVTRDEALAFPISHPNCRRAFGPRPDLTNVERERRLGGQVTAAQTEAQRAQDAARAAARERRALRQQQTAARRAQRGPAATVERRAARLQERATASAPAPAPAPFSPGTPSIPGLRRTDLEAVNRYAWDQRTYLEFNENLRAGSALSPDLQTRIDELQGIIEANPIDTDVQVYRLLAMDDDSMFGEFVPGEIFEEKGFMSTALDPDRAEDFDVYDAAIMLQIEARAGTPALHVGDSLDQFDAFDQTEVLFGKGTQIEVIGTEQVETEWGTPRLIVKGRVV